MFIPNTFGLLTPLTGMNADAEPVYGVQKRVACAIAALNSKVLKTSIRVDASASRGDSEETELMSEIMFPAKVSVKIDDRFKIAGVTMRAINVAPRYDVMGRLDHSEVQFVTLVEQE